MLNEYSITKTKQKIIFFVVKIRYYHLKFQNNKPIILSLFFLIDKNIVLIIIK